MFYLAALIALVTHAADPSCATQRDAFRDAFTKAYVAPVKLIYDHAFAQMSADKRDEVAKMRARLAEDERRLAAAINADPKMTDILSHDHEEARRAFETMKSIKREQRRYKGEIADLEYKMNMVLSAYLARHRTYLEGVEAEARKLGVTLKVDRRAANLKNVTVTKSVSDGASPVYLVKQSFWSRADEVQIEVIGPEKVMLTMDAYADLHLAAECRH